MEGFSAPLQGVSQLPLTADMFPPPSQNSQAAGLKEISVLKIKIRGHRKLEWLLCTPGVSKCFAPWARWGPAVIADVLASHIPHAYHFHEHLAYFIWTQYLHHNKRVHNTV